MPLTKNGGSIRGKMWNVKRKVLYFTAPRQVEIREETLPALGAHDVLVETICSAISAGTEMLIYQGHFPRDMENEFSYFRLTAAAFSIRWHMGMQVWEWSRKPVHK